MMVSTSPSTLQREIAEHIVDHALIRREIALAVWDEIVLPLYRRLTPSLDGSMPTDLE